MVTDKMAQEGRLKWFCREILGREIDLDVFEEKLTIQKATYITQQLGMRWDYVYGWYVRGVYSSKLTVDLYEQKNLNPAYEPAAEEKAVMERIRPIKTLFSGLSEFKNMQDAYELVSTIVYAKKHKQMTKKEEITGFTKNVKPWFSDEHIERAMEYVEELNQA